MSDPITALLLKVVMSMAPTVANSALNPTTVQPSAATVQRSLGDAGEGILKCYHHTGDFRSVSVVEAPWSGARQYRADRSVLLRIDWQGRYLRSNYTTVVALMERDQAIKTHVVSDSAVVPKNASCGLENWAVP